jgi:hypothetical protein
MGKDGNYREGIRFVFCKLVLDSFRTGTRNPGPPLTVSRSAAESFYGGRSSRQWTWTAGYFSGDPLRRGNRTRGTIGGDGGLPLKSREKSHGGGDDRGGRSPGPGVSGFGDRVHRVKGKGKQGAGQGTTTIEAAIGQAPPPAGRPGHPPDLEHRSRRLPFRQRSCPWLPPESHKKEKAGSSPGLHLESQRRSF